MGKHRCFECGRTLTSKKDKLCTECSMQKQWLALGRQGAQGLFDEALASGKEPKDSLTDLVAFST